MYILLHIIVKAREKMGGAPRPERQMLEFRGALDFCGFRDLGYVGSLFTWCNNQLSYDWGMYILHANTKSEYDIYIYMCSFPSQHSRVRHNYFIQFRSI